DVVDHGVDGREGGQDLLDWDADLERGVPLRVKRVRGAHAAGHPEEDAGVRGRGRVLDRVGGEEARRAAGDGGEARGRHGAEEVAAGEFRINHGGPHTQSGKCSTLSAHSCCSLQWATRRISSTMSPMRFVKSRMTNTPGIGRPARTRSYA